MAFAGSDRKSQGILSIFQDRSDARAESERRDLLLAEMGHRLKNVFGIICAIVIQTRWYASSIDEFHESVDERVVALARSTNLVMRVEWSEAPLTGVVENCLGAFCDLPGRLTRQGSPVMVAFDCIASLSLSLHELATNAIKYGAWSSLTGHVHLE